MTTMEDQGNSEFQPVKQHNSITTEQPIDVNALVKVQVSEGGIVAKNENRFDAQVSQPNLYANESFQKVLRIKDGTKARLEDPDPQVKAEAAKYNEEAWKEINARREEARQAGYLAPVDRVIQPLDAQYNALATRVAQGNANIGDLQNYISLINNMNLNNANIQNPQGRLNGVPQFHFETQLNRLRNRATQLIAQISQSPVQQPQNPNTGGGNELKELVDIGKRQLRAQQETLEATLGSYRQLIRAEDGKLIVDPENTEKQGWFTLLSPERQGAIRFRLAKLQLASVKVQVAREKLKLDDYHAQKPEMRTDYAQLEWNNMPGYRIALATMLKDNYTIKQGHEGEIDHIVISDNGYNNLATNGGHEKYKRKLISKIEAYLEANEPNVAQEEDIPLHDVAVAAVASADNFLSGLAVPDGADEKRKLKADGQTPGHLYAEPVRTFFLPGIKGRLSKWIKHETDDTSEEGWGGPVGVYLMDRATDPNERNRFRKWIENGDVQYIPDRMIYTVLDHTRGKDGTVHEGETLAEALMMIEDDRERRDLGNGLCDYEQGARAIEWGAFGRDLFSGYTGVVRDPVIKISNHLTSSDEKQRFVWDSVNKDSFNKFADAIKQLRVEPALRYIYTDYDVNDMAILLLACPQGPKLGTNELMPDAPSYGGYDQIIYNILLDPRVSIEGMPRGYKDHAYKTLNAKRDDHSVVNEMLNPIVRLGKKAVDVKRWWEDRKVRRYLRRKSRQS